MRIEKAKALEADEAEIEDPTSKEAILSSIAQFLPEKNRSRMERLVREQELTNKRRRKKKKVEPIEEKPLGAEWEEVKEEVQQYEAAADTEKSLQSA